MLLVTLLTVGRAAMGPVFLALFPIHNGWTDVLCLLIAIGVEVSDVLDGYLARKRGSVTQIGKVLDPFADSVARFSIFLALFIGGICPLWVLMILFYRDALVLNLRMVASLQGKAVAARISGKLKAVVQGTAIITVLVLLADAKLELGIFGTTFFVEAIRWSIIAAGAITALSGVDYTIAVLRMFRRSGFATATSTPPDPSEPTGSTSE